MPRLVGKNRLLRMYSGTSSEIVVRWFDKNFGHLKPARVNVVNRK